MSFLTELAYVPDVRTILSQCVTFGNTGEIDEDRLDIDLGITAIKLMRQN